jgi:hypothetical protein
LSAKVKKEYDCAGERYRILAFSQFSGRKGKGKVVNSSDEEGNWVQVAPDTIDGHLWDLACNKR